MISCQPTQYLFTLFLFSYQILDFCSFSSCFDGNISFYDFLLFINRFLISSIQFIEEVMYRSHLTSMSPYKTTSRVATYLQALQKDDTINLYRGQYAKHKLLEAQYDDLHYEISKAERENKKLQQKNLQIQDEYMDKIKGNKGLITQVGQQIEQIQQKIKNVTQNFTQKQAQNEKLIDEIKQTKNKITECQQDNKKLEAHIQSQDTVINNLVQTLEELLIKKKQTQMGNKNQSEVIDGEFEQYKSLQEKIKSQETLNLELREELNTIKSQKIKFQSKVEQIQAKMKQMRKKLQHTEFESDKLSKRCHQAQKQSSKVYGQALELKQNIQKSLTKNKDQTTKLKTLQSVLKQNINGLHVKHTTKQRLTNGLSQVNKQIQKTEALILALDQQTEQQEQNNKGLIQNLKKSIQSDEEAVKALTRKAAILNLISQS